MGKENDNHAMIMLIYAIMTTAVLTFNAMNIEKHYIFVVSTIVAGLLLFKIVKSFHETTKEK